MTNDTCRVPTPEEQMSLEIQDAVNHTMMQKVFQAVNDAA